MRRHIVRLRRLGGVFVFVATVMATQLSGVQFAHALTTDVWTGTAGDNKFATASNWAGNVAPVSGDILSFSAVSSGATRSLINDLGAGVSLGGVTINGGFTSTTTAYTIDTLSFATGATIVSSGTDTTLTVSGAVSSAGSLGVTGVGGALIFAGAINTTGDLTISGSNINLSNTLTVGGAAVLTGTYVNNNDYFNINGAVKVTGNLTLAGTNLGVNSPVTVGGNLVATASLYATQVYTVTGNVTIGDANNYGTIYLSTGSVIKGTATVVKGSLYQTSGATITLGGLVVDNGAGATLDGNTSFPITFGSGASAAYPSLVYNTGTYNSQTQNYTYNNLTISSPITLLNNLSVLTNGDATSGSVSFTGAVTYNGFTISKYLGSSGKLFINGVEIKNAPVTSQYTGNLPQTSFDVAESETAVLSGTRNSANVYTGGILKGTGILTNSLYVSYGGTVSPGNSPGMLTMLQSLYLNSGAIYQAEILDATHYDQLQVGAQYSTTGNAVTLGTGTNLPTLNLVLLPGYVIKKGDSFRIIDNMSKTAVSGTFATLPEGTQFTVSGITFSISYVGGDGNDIVLTALSTGSAPAIPNTGAEPLKLANPAVLIGLGIVAAGMLLTLARRRFNN